MSTPVLVHELSRGDGLELVGYLCCAGRIAIGNHDVRATRGKQLRHFAADAAGAAHHQGDAAAELLLSRLAANLGFFKSPVLDAKRFNGGQGNVVGDRP